MSTGTWKKNRKLTPQERKDLNATRVAELKALGEALEAFKDTLSPGEAALIYARFDRYSENNALLIAQQAPDATDVGGFTGWIARGYVPRKGEGIRIMAPNGSFKVGTPEEGDATPDGSEEAKRIMRYKAVTVWDIKHVDPKPVKAASPELVTA